MSNALSIKLSRHAETRLLERTSLAGEVLLDRFAAGAVFWLPVKQDDGARHALVYCAATEAYFVVVLLPDTGVVKTILTAEQWEHTHTPLLPIWRALAVQLTLQCLEAKKSIIQVVTVDLTCSEPAMRVIWSADHNAFAGCFEDFEAYRVRQRYPKETTKGVFAYVWATRSFQDWLFKLLGAHNEVSPLTHEVFLVVGPEGAALENLVAVSTWALIARRVSSHFNRLLQHASHIPVLDDRLKRELATRIDAQRVKQSAEDEKARFKKIRALETARAQEEARVRKLAAREQARAQARAKEEDAARKRTELTRKKSAVEMFEALAPQVGNAAPSPEEQAARAEATRNEFENYVASLIRKRQETLAAQPLQEPEGSSKEKRDC